MLVSSILALPVGILLGLRFKVLILLPASLGALLGVICAGVVRADSPWNVGLSAAVAIACLQVGYLAGIAILDRLASAKPGRLSWFHGPLVGVRDAAQTSCGVGEMGLVAYGHDRWGAYLNEEFRIASPPSAPLASPDIGDPAHIKASHVD